MDTPLLGTTPGNGADASNTWTGSIQPLTSKKATNHYTAQGVAQGLWPTHKGLCLALLLAGATLGALAFMGLFLVAGLFSKSG